MGQGRVQRQEDARRVVLLDAERAQRQREQLRARPASRNAPARSAAAGRARRQLRLEAATSPRAAIDKQLLDAGSPRRKGRCGRWKRAVAATRCADRRARSSSADEIERGLVGGRADRSRARSARARAGAAGRWRQGPKAASVGSSAGFAASATSTAGSWRTRRRSRVRASRSGRRARLRASGRRAEKQEIDGERGSARRRGDDDRAGLGRALRRGPSRIEAGVSAQGATSAGDRRRASRARRAAGSRARSPRRLGSSRRRARGARRTVRHAAGAAPPARRRDSRSARANPHRSGQADGRRHYATLSERNAGAANASIRGGSLSGSLTRPARWREISRDEAIQRGCSREGGIDDGACTKAQCAGELSQHTRNFLMTAAPWRKASEPFGTKRYALRRRLSLRTFGKSISAHPFETVC